MLLFGDAFESLLIGLFGIYFEICVFHDTLDGLFEVELVTSNNKTLNKWEIFQMRVWLFTEDKM
jgi:hypothetical protein